MEQLPDPDCLAGNLWKSESETPFPASVARGAGDIARDVRQQNPGSKGSPTELAAMSSESEVSGPAGSAELGPAELIDRHQRGVWRYLRMLGCDPATADDLTQETFLRVLRRRNFVQHNDTATAGYLRRTAYNLLVSRHRKLGRVHTVTEASVLDEIWDRWAGKDLSGDLAIDSLRLCLKSLSARAQLALKLRFADEASRLEIGQALGISEHGARNLMQRAKQQLRRCVEDRLQQHRTKSTS